MGALLSRFSLDGKVAIVTGASRGLGQGMALALADAGADIVAVATRDLNETVTCVEALGRTCLPVIADLSERDSIPRVMAEALKSFYQLDVLVNCAGIIRRADFIDFTEKDWDDVMKVNLDATFFLSQAFAREALARQRPAKIINIASIFMGC